MTIELAGVWTDIGDAVKEPPRFIIEGVLPSGIVFVGGPPKSKKSTLELALALLVAGHKNLKVLPEDMQEVLVTGRVMILSAEHSAGELRYMIEDGMGIQLTADKGILIGDDPWQWRLDDPDGVERLLGWLDELNPLLFIIDPLVDFHSMDENDSGQMNRLLRPIQKWAKNKDACFMIIHHTNKKKDDDKASFKPSNLRGAGSIFGLADGVLMLTPTTDDMIHIDATFKRGRGWKRVVKLGVWGDDMVEGETQRLSTLATQLVPHIKQGITNYEVLAKATKVSKSKVVLAIKELTDAGVVEQRGRQLVVKE